MPAVTEVSARRQVTAMKAVKRSTDSSRRVMSTLKTTHLPSTMTRTDHGWQDPAGGVCVVVWLRRARVAGPGTARPRRPA